MKYPYQIGECQKCGIKADLVEVDMYDYDVRIFDGANWIKSPHRETARKICVDCCAKAMQLSPQPLSGIPTEELRAIVDSPGHSGL